MDTNPSLLGFQILLCLDFKSFSAWISNASLLGLVVNLKLVNLRLVNLRLVNLRLVNLRLVTFRLVTFRFVNIRLVNLW